MSEISMLASHENAEDASSRLAAGIEFCRRTLSLPLCEDGGRLTVATADTGPENLARLRARYGADIAIEHCSRAALVEALETRFRASLLEEAVNGLERRHPDLSARRVMTRAQAFVLVCLPIVICVALFAWPHFGDVAFALVLGLSFVANAMFRAVLVWLGAEPVATHSPAPADNTETLPLYSVIIPLYREAEIVLSLLEALDALDYPKSRTEIFLVVEADDGETRKAIEAAAPDPNVIVLPVLPSMPRTKPKAANYALGFVTGEFTVIYDAEDRPEPDQLRKAVAAFRSAPQSLACLQARLNFYNAEENWLTRGIMAQTPPLAV